MQTILAESICAQPGSCNKIFDSAGSALGLAINGLIFVIFIVVFLASLAIRKRHLSNSKSPNKLKVLWAIWLVVLTLFTMWLIWPQ